MTTTTTPYSVTCAAAPPDTIEGPFPVTQPTDAQLTIDRTVTGGLNSLTSADVVSVYVEGNASASAGPTDPGWRIIVATDLPGGARPAPFNDANEMNAGVADPTQVAVVRVRVTPSAAVVLAGNVVITT